MCQDGKYERELKNGLFDGKGTFYFKNGDRYEGNWKKGIKEGRGIYYYSNRDRYEGNGGKEIKKEKEYIIILMVIDMKVTGRITKEKEMV